MVCGNSGKDYTHLVVLFVLQSMSSSACSQSSICHVKVALRSLMLEEFTVTVCVSVIFEGHRVVL